MSNQENNQINLLGLIKWLVISVKKNFRILLIMNLAIAAIGIGMKLYIAKSYEGSLIVKSNIIEYHFISGILEPLSQHILDQKTESLSKSLNLPMELAETFGGYEINSLIDEEYVSKRKNTASENLTEYEKDNVFELKIRSREIKNLPILKNAVLDYLRNQKYIKDRQAFFLKKQEEIKNLYAMDIESMRIIKEGFAKKGFDPSIASNDLLIEGLGDFYYGSIKVYEESLNANYLFEFNDSFEELSDFEIYTRHVYPRWTPFILGIVLIGGVLSFLYILIIEIKASIKEDK